MSFTPTPNLSHTSNVNLRDSQTASQLFVSDQFRLAPKWNFQFHVRFSINSAALMSNSIVQRHTDEINMLVKTCDLPSYEITSETVNQYNRKANVQTKLTYDPISLEFHDDNSQITSSLWRLYYNYYFSDGENLNGEFQNKWIGDTKYNGDYIYGYSPTKNLPFFDSVDIYVFHNGRYSQYSIANPLISSWEHDNVEQGNGTKILQNKMSLVYDNVSYDEGEILDEEKIAPAIDEAPFYDHDVNIDQAYRPESKPYTVRTKQYPTPEKPGLNLSQLDKVSSAKPTVPTGLNFSKLSNLKGTFPVTVPPRPAGAGTVGLSSIRPPGVGITGLEVWYGYGGLHGRAVINAGPVSIAVKK